jgi:hypothetical protein
MLGKMNKEPLLGVTNSFTSISNDWTIGWRIATSILFRRVCYLLSFYSAALAGLFPTRCWEEASL